MTKEMEEWAYYAMDAIHREAQMDPGYREQVDRWMQLREGYEALCADLSRDQRELLLEYFCCVEEMQFQKIRVAYFLGKKRAEDF